MQKILKLKAMKNAYCDAVGLSLGEFCDFCEIEDEIDIIQNLTDEEIEKICEYAVLKNKLAGVGELFLKVPKPNVAKRFFQQYQICGKEILSAKLFESFTLKDLVGNQSIIEVESLLEYNEDYLSKIVDFAASTQMPVLIKMGQTLEEVGKVVNKFNSSPAEVLEDYGFLDRECYIYGLNFLDKEDQKLLKSYNPTLILSPRDDGESGRGAINLYNLIFNDLKFVFSSGKCYNIDMFFEGKLALLNTSNLMYQRDLVSSSDVLSALQSEYGEGNLEIDDDALQNTILDHKIEIKDANLEKKILALREEIKLIAKKIKEKI